MTQIKLYNKSYFIVCATACTLAMASLFGCQEKKEVPIEILDSPQQVEMVTNFGTMVIELYDETPLHRDNFINLAKNKAYDSLLFHRVIEKFMIQGGDPDSRSAKPTDTLGDGDAPYMVPAEFRNNLFHKKGVLAAARDDNAARSSSGMQFYIVQGKVFNDSLLALASVRINKNMAFEFAKSNSSLQSLVDAMDLAKGKNDFKSYYALKDSIYGLAIQKDEFVPYQIPEDQRNVYKTVGGTPHLDQNYTVFGEVIEGLSVIDSIATVNTDLMNRPLTDVIIKSVRLLDKK